MWSKFPSIKQVLFFEIFLSKEVAYTWVNLGRFSHTSTFFHTHIYINYQCRIAILSLSQCSDPLDGEGKPKAVKVFPIMNCIWTTISDALWFWNGYSRDWQKRHIALLIRKTLSVLCWWGVWCLNWIEIRFGCMCVTCISSTLLSITSLLFIRLTSGPNVLQHARDYTTYACECVQLFTHFYIHTQKMCKYDAQWFVHVCT